MSRPDLRLLEDSLRWLAGRGFLSGSLGRGERFGKDIDVHCHLKHVKALKELLNAQGVSWESPVTGAITWHPEGTQVEVSDLFPRYKTGKKMLYGITFRT
jgi:hypothetical protein